jgi:hypothetical protein
VVIQAAHVSCIEKNFSLEVLRIRDHLYVSTDGSIIKTQHLRVSSEFSNRLHSEGDFCEHGNEPLSFIKCREFLDHPYDYKLLKKRL